MEGRVIGRKLRAQYEPEGGERRCRVLTAMQAHAVADTHEHAQ